MVIDTHNRGYNGSDFKAGPLPKASCAPENAFYSGLIEIVNIKHFEQTIEIQEIYLSSNNNIHSISNLIFDKNNNDIYIGTYFGEVYRIGN